MPAKQLRRYRPFPFVPLSNACECEACQHWTLLYWDEGLTFPYGALMDWMSAQSAERSLTWCDSARSLRHTWVWVERQRALRRS